MKNCFTIYSTSEFSLWTILYTQQFSCFWLHIPKAENQIGPTHLFRDPLLVLSLNLEKGGVPQNEEVASLGALIQQGSWTGGRRILWTQRALSGPAASACLNIYPFLLRKKMLFLKAWKEVVLYCANSATWRQSWFCPCLCVQEVHLSWAYRTPWCLRVLWSHLSKSN